MLILALSMLTYYAQLPDLLILETDFAYSSTFTVATGRIHVIAYLLITSGIWIVAAEIHRDVDSKYTSLFKRNESILLLHFCR